MKELDDLYCKLLRAGFIILRQAVGERNFDWLNAEVNLLHNVPSLVGETISQRHEYFWNCERTAYIEWIVASGTDMQKSRMRTYYEPIWKNMEALIAKKP